METTDRLKAIRARADAATPGPWDYDDSLKNSEIWAENEPVANSAYWPSTGGEDAHDRNGLFIAAAREDIPFLLDALEAPQRENADLEAQLDELRGDASIEVNNELARDCNRLQAENLRLKAPLTYDECTQFFGPGDFNRKSFERVIARRASGENQ